MQVAARQLLSEEKVGQLNPSEGIVELELIEYADEVGTSPKRLEMFIKSITKLHMVLALLFDLKEDRLIFKYFDSGSGMLVGIKCAVKIATGLSALLSQWWDRIVFHRYETHEKKIEAFAKTLDIVDTIHQKVEKGVITAEVGENWKIRMFREVETLTEIGAIIPLKEATIDQRQLLTEIRNTKLLGSGDASEESGPPTS
jgi:hypothetical protein